MRHPLVETLVGTSLVVLGNEHTEDVLEVTPAKDQEVVKQLPANGAHPPLSKGIGPRCPVGKPNYPHAFAGEDLIKGSRELGVPIAEQETGPQPGALERPNQVAGLLRHPGRRRMGGAATQMDTAAADLEEEEDV